jgi:hypothetical protein
MKTYKTVILIVTFGLIAGTAVALNWLKANQKLGTPGIKAEAIPGSPTMKFDLPEHVLDCTSSNLPPGEIVVGYLPPDTSFAGRRYQTPDGLGIYANIILQGADRSSIHKPDYCLSGQGYNVISRRVESIPIAGPAPYELPVSVWIGSRLFKTAEGQSVEIRSVYVFWFVADRELTPSYDQHLSWIRRDLLRTGVMPRWAYVTYQVQNLVAGQEEAAFEHMKQLIAASVPEFQLPPAPTGSAPGP